MQTDQEHSKYCTSSAAAYDSDYENAKYANQTKLNFIAM